MNIERELKRLAPRSDAASEAAARALAGRAADERLVDVAVATMDSPVGELLVAVTPRGLVRIAYEGEDRDRVLADLARELSPRILEAASLTDEARSELDEYFRRERTRFDLKLDRRLIGPFAWDVLSATKRVGFGRTATYGEIAGKIGRPKAARAVGRALGSNPIPIVIPCHRIVGASGALTGYGGGLPRKQTLLSLEGATLQMTDIRRTK
jgi:methylated-DNA-[protein]-cysteine S-methyltransferase